MSIVGSEQWMYSSGREFYEFPIEQSLRFNDNDSAKLTRTPASASNRQTWTWSGWLKRSNLNTKQTFFCSTAGDYNLHFATDNKLKFEGAYGTTATDAVFRDVSSFYHILAIHDTTEAISSDRFKIFVNGVQQTTSGSYPSGDGVINNTVQHGIGGQASVNFFDGYMADVNFIDGQALDPTSFGELKSGIWIPKDTAGLTFGTNGFRLQFGDSAAIGDDTSGNTNDWTVNNLVASDVLLDSPTNSWCVWNPLEKTYNTGTPSDGNLTVANSFTCGGTIAIPDDGTKVYFESENVTAINTSGGNFAFGVHEPNNTNWHFNSTSSNAWIVYASSGGAGGSWRFIANGTTGYIASPAATAAGTVHGCAVWKDGSNWKVYISRGGTWYDSSGTALGSFTEGSPTFTFSYDGLLVPFGAGQANFGQSDFTYTPPDNYVALNSANLPSGAINTLNDETPEDYFNTVLYTGDGANPRSVSSVNFQPDFVWFKARNVARSHRLVDVVRGVQKDLFSDTTGAENTATTGLLSFDSDGFTVGSGNGYNASGETQVAWNWKAGGSGVSNTDGSITSTVSVGATSQQNWFSIVSYTGTGANATVGHGLDGTVPEMVIAKRRDGTNNSWGVYHSGMTSATYQMWLAQTNGEISRPAQWNSTAPTSSVFSIGTDTDVNVNGSDYIAYCFANAEGLCRAGSYVGNGSADGTFVYTGHRPSFLLIKRKDAASDWVLWDAKRDPYNYVGRDLQPDKSDAELSYGEDVDFVSNGFKIRRSGTNFNASGGSYIFLSISEQPFKFANAR